MLIFVLGSKEFLPLISQNLYIDLWRGLPRKWSSLCPLVMTAAEMVAVTVRSAGITPASPRHQQGEGHVSQRVNKLITEILWKFALI